MPDSSAFFAERFFQDIDARIARYDLLQHPFYTAWSRGELTRDDLREYAGEYWHHVSAFPTYLSALHSQLPDGELRRTVLANLADEEGMRDGTPHSDMWMDFARGMGAGESTVRSRELKPETRAMISHFRETMYGAPAEALAALYAYESRVPAIAATKAEGLEKHYAADEAARRYFTVHTVADVFHSQVWRDLLAAELAADPAQAPELVEAALESAENTARFLWTTLDGIEASRQSRLAAAA
jgi:pyrroloquinoline-quinone synthase